MYIYIYLSIYHGNGATQKKIMAMDQYNVSDKTYHHNHASFLCQSLCFTDHRRGDAIGMARWPSGPSATDLTRRQLAGQTVARANCGKRQRDTPCRQGDSFHPPWPGVARHISAHGDGLTYGMVGAGFLNAY